MPPSPPSHDAPASATPAAFDDLAARFTQGLPQGVRALGAELEANFRAVLREAADRLELVPRERFDVQAEMLARAQNRLRGLEERVKALEGLLAAPAASPPAASPAASPAAPPAA